MRIIQFIFKLLTHVLTIVFSGLLVASYLASALSPDNSWVFALLALSAPVTVVITAALMLYNAARLRWIALLPLIVLLSGSSIIDGQFNFKLSKDYDNDKGAIKIMTHNTRRFRDDEYKMAVDSAINLTTRENPSIIAYQEFSTSKTVDEDSIKSLLKQYKFSAIKYYKENTTNGNALAIFSKYKIIDSGSKIFYDDLCGMHWADIVISKDTVRLFNVHMKSNQLSSKESSMLSSNISDIEPLLRESNTESRDSVYIKGVTKFKDVLRRYSKAVSTRAVHSDTLSQIIAESPYPSIICGDFNDVPFSYTYHKLKGNHTDAFSKEGALYGYTYNRLHKFLKIDHFFLPKEYEVVRYNSYDVDHSDHNPIFVWLKKREE